MSQASPWAQMICRRCIRRLVWLQSGASSYSDVQLGFDCSPRPAPQGLEGGVEPSSIGHNQSVTYVRFRAATNGSFQSSNFYRPPGKLPS